MFVGWTRAWWRQYLPNNLQPYRHILLVIIMVITWMWCWCWYFSYIRILSYWCCGGVNNVCVCLYFLVIFNVFFSVLYCLLYLSSSTFIRFTLYLFDGYDGDVLISLRTEISRIARIALSLLWLDALQICDYNQLLFFLLILSVFVLFFVQHFCCCFLFWSLNVLKRNKRKHY